MKPEAWTIARRFVAVTSIFATVAACQVMAASKAEAARLCSARKVTATGSSATQSIVARRIAQTRWERKVRSVKGSDPKFARWSRAREKTTVCRKLADRHVCLAAALPCRSGRI